MRTDLIGSFGMNVNYAGMQGVNEEVQEAAEVFAAMMSQQQEFAEPMMDSVSSGNDTVQDVKPMDSAQDSYKRYNYKERHINEAKETDFSEKAEEAAGEMEEFEQEALDAISEEFGVEKEEVMAVLDEMGLSVLDLLNPQNLVNFVMELTGITAKEELLLNDGFLSIMGTMDSMKKDLMAELELTPEGLEQLTAQMKQLHTEESIAFSDEFTKQKEPKVNTEAAEEETIHVQNAATAEETEVSEEALEAAKNAENTGAKDGIEASDTEESQVKVEVVKEENAANLETENPLERNLAGDNENSRFTDNNQQSGESFMANASNVNNVPTADTSQINSYLNTNTMEIIEQIAEQVRIHVTADTKSVEMQLNPENLGKIYVNISEENGMIHAQFTATNEIVKEALESQLATLRENLNQAGVKVDAIEVTVQTHQFEHNLEQNHKREENEGAYQEEMLQRRRNLNINALDELSGMMTEEEALVAQIMMDNGNSVDLTA
uniref:flagellar hook-length control protein FliK n=1 Tax=Agathobacter sp. TaxID=2021311 RepID=UPI0040562642